MTRSLSTIASPPNAEREAAFDRAIAEIAAYGHLKAGWDSYAGSAACEQSVEFCRGLLSAVRQCIEVSVPLVRPISSGVYLEWRKGESKLYFEADESSVLFIQTTGEAVISSGDDDRFDVFAAATLVRAFHGAD